MRIASVTLVVLLFAATALAQTAPAVPAQPATGMRFEQLKSYLDLTPSQVEQLKSLETTQRTTIMPIFKEMRTIDTNLRAELNKQPVDPARITQLRAESQTKRTDIQSQRAQLRTQILGVLNTQQQAKLQQLEEALKLQVPARQAAMLDLIPAPNGVLGMQGRMAEARFMNRWGQRRWGQMEMSGMNAPKSNP